MLNPSDSVVDWVLRLFLPWELDGAAGNLGYWFRGYSRKAMLMAKEALLEHIDIQELKAKGAENVMKSYVGVV